MKLRKQTNYTSPNLLSHLQIILTKGKDPPPFPSKAIAFPSRENGFKNNNYERLIHAFTILLVQYKFNNL